MVAPLRTYNDIYLAAREKLREAGIGAFSVEARLIMAGATGRSGAELLSESRSYLTDNDVIRSIDEMIGRRLAGEPVAYITGEWEFYGIPLNINNAVLIPRIDTEILAAEAIRIMKEPGGKAGLLDLCTGSGCVGLAVAANVPGRRVVLADNSERALAVCRGNIVRNRLTGNTQAIAADALAAPHGFPGVFDAIVCNPPYIPTCEISALEASVRDYEPFEALDGGGDGLDFYRAVSSKWKSVLAEGGYLAFECAAGRSKDVHGIMTDSGFTCIRALTDTLGFERVMVGRKQ